MPSGHTLSLRRGHLGSEGPERTQPGDVLRLCPDARGDARTCQGFGSAPQTEQGRHPPVSPGTGGHAQHRLLVLSLSSQSPANTGSETRTRPRATFSLIPGPHVRPELLSQAAQPGMAGPGPGTTWRWTPPLPLAPLLREGTQGRAQPRKCRDEGRLSPKP